jgi:hypothetical protein
MTDRPRYMEPKRLAGDVIAWYWNPKKRIMDELVATKAPITRRSLGTDYAKAAAAARRFNDELDHWLLHHRMPGEPEAARIIPGSVDDVFRTYMDHMPSREGSFAQLEPETQYDYERLMKRFADYVLTDGRRVGQVKAVDLDPATVDDLYEELLYDEDGVARKRVTNHMMAACRRAWNIARRAKPSLVPAANPFDKMNLNHKAAETKPATWEQLVTFREKACEMGYPEVAFAAQAAWDLLQRVEEVCLRFAWNHYRPEDRPNHVFVAYDKNDNPVWKPLQGTDDDGKVVLFYPDLEDAIAKVPKRASLVCAHVVRKGRQKPDPDKAPVYKGYDKRMMQKRAKAIRKAAKLPDHVTLETFRHGGLTECGSAGLSDTLAQALSRHKQRGTLDRYIHNDEEQMVKASHLRLAHRRERK